MDSVILQGGGEHAKVVLDCLLAQGVSVKAIFDPKHSDSLLGIQCRGEYDPEFATNSRAIVAIGDNRLRKSVAEATNHEFANAIHPSAIISSFTSLGLGCMILHGVIIQVHAQIGNHVILNTGARIDHDCQVEDFVHIAPGAVLCGRVKVGVGTLIGAGSVVLPGVKIGAWSTVGAGSVVTRNVEEGDVVFGNPARTSKH